MKKLDPKKIRIAKIVTAVVAVVVLILIPVVWHYVKESKTTDETLNTEQELAIVEDATENTPAVATPSATSQNSVDQGSTSSTTTTPSQTPATATITRPIWGAMNKEVNIGNTTKKNIALTLDAGSGSTQTESILAILKQNNIKITFFLTGKWAEQNPTLVKKILADGHTIGNHTYDHKDLTTLSDADIKTEFDKTETIVKGIVPTAVLKPYFRPPYGARNKHVWDYCASLGYQSIYWTVDAWDWKTDATAEIVKQRIYDNARNGAIILMHVGDDITPAVLPEVIAKLKADGYQVGNLESVLSI